MRIGLLSYGLMSLDHARACTLKENHLLRQRWAYLVLQRVSGVCNKEPIQERDSYDVTDWKMNVEFHSRRSLTYQKDRLVVFHGITSELQLVGLSHYYVFW